MYIKNTVCRSLRWIRRVIRLILYNNNKKQQRNSVSMCSDYVRNLFRWGAQRPAMICVANNHTRSLFRFGAFRRAMDSRLFAYCLEYNLRVKDTRMGALSRPFSADIWRRWSSGASLFKSMWCATAVWHTIRECLLPANNTTVASILYMWWHYREGRFFVLCVLWVKKRERALRGHDPRDRVVVK